MKNKKSPFFEYYDNGRFDECPDDMYFSYSNPKKSLTKMAKIQKIPGLTVEAQLDYMIDEYNDLVDDFNHLCTIVLELQQSFQRLMYYSEYKFETVEHVLMEHCSGFHAALIIDNKKEDKDESDIS